VDEQAFRAHVRTTLGRIHDAVDALPTDAVDLRIGDGVLTLEFDGGGSWILSQQVPVQELWLAADRQAWHFAASPDGWRERTSGEPLEALLGRLLTTRLGLAVDLGG